ncbi:MAG: hypothetical protein ACJ8IR_08245 [Alphaproteobacteria bacterium]
MTAESDNAGFGRLVVFTWLGLAFLLVLKAAQTPGGLILSPDDAMRLVQVRDLLHGQSWFDTTQWRMNAPYGLPMHWSRLVDAGIAGLLLLFRLFTNPKTAEAWALYVWPLLPLLPVLFALTHIAQRLTGRMGALFTLALGASCVAAMTPFKPGNIDHHNVQLALGLSFAAFLIDIDRSRRAGIFAGAMAALSLAVGLETLPYVLVALMALAVWWTFGPRIAGNVAAFGATFGGANLLLLTCATASVYRFSAACDTFSGFYAALGVLTGVGIIVLTGLGVVNTPLRRAAGAAGLCILVLAVAALIGPACLHGPYVAVDARLGSIWLSGVAEDQSPFTMGLMAPGDFVGGYVYCALAAAAALAAIFLLPVRHRASMAVLGAIALTAFAIASAQMRGIAFALLFATPGVVVVATWALERVRLGRTASMLATFAAVLVSSDATYAMVGQQIQKSLPAAQQYTPVQQIWMQGCTAPKAFRELARLPQSRVATFVDMGPMVLAYTPHATIAGPYHRNAAGILDTYSIFAGSAAEQRATLKRRAVDYVVICSPAPDYKEWGAMAQPDSLLRADAHGQIERWLEPLANEPKGGAIRIFRVRRESLD